MNVNPLSSLFAMASLALALQARAADAPKATPEALEKGKASYAKLCASCHGPTGAGDGPASKALKPPPKNLADAKGGAQGVYEVLSSGVKGTAMIAFKHVSEPDRWAIAHYVASLKGSKK
jgi:high-affinity iron transporter